MAKSRREWSPEGVKGEEEEGGGCADLIGMSSQQEPSNGRKQAFSSCQVGREDSWLFCSSVNQAHESHFMPGLCPALRHGPLRPGFSSSSPPLGHKDHLGDQDLGQELPAE